MRSIRLSLMVYFLALLAVALTAASFLVYRNAEQTLEAKQLAMEQLIRTQYRERSGEEERRLDETLLAQAQSLARIVQVQFDWDRVESRAARLSLHALGLLSSNLSPNSHLLAPVWIAEGMPGNRPSASNRTLQGRRPPPEDRSSRRGPWLSWVFRELHRKSLYDLTLKGDRLLLPGEVCDYFQIDSPSGNPYHSPSMAGRTFTLNSSVFAADRLVDWVYDDYVLPPDAHVRRVVFKASGVDEVWNWSSLRGAPPTPRPSVHPGLTIYVHCAADTNQRDAAIAELRRQRDQELAAVEGRTDESLRALRFWLLGISLAVFAATAAGSFCLVRLGLAPLRRLSDAVSRVSVKDFRLPLGERPLPLELQPIAKRLTGTLDLLKRAFAREKQASADISHELRTPLAALLTATEFALRKPRSPEQYRELLGDCHTSAQQMNQIVERLLTLARLDAGVDRLRVQAADVAALAQQCAAMIRPLAEARGLTLTVKCPPSASAITSNGAGGDGTCLAEVDSDKLREIISNLLHNAIQYNRPGGSVDLRVTRGRNTLEIEVRDSGIGIARESRELIFERFYRIDPSRGGDDLHSGLGLAIVKEYIDLMGGSINVESIEEQGSSFRVLLPLR